MLLFKDMVQAFIDNRCLHPEVYKIYYIGFLMLLYAEITPLFSSNYLSLKWIVIMLKQKSLSAGNKLGTFWTRFGTLEALRNENTNEVEQVKSISPHVPKHSKPTYDNLFGDYLAGLIDGNGYFTNDMKLIINFKNFDASLAYFVKKQLGFGQVKITDNNVIFVVTKKNGIEKAIQLINGRLRSKNILNQIETNILNKWYFIQGFHLNIKNDITNYWLTGLSDVMGSFQINIVNSSINNPEIQLRFLIVHPNKDLLILIKNVFGGNISYIEEQAKYYYASNSFYSAKNFIHFFDYQQLNSRIHVNYLKWRKTYILIQENKYLTRPGLEKIIKNKNSINKLETINI